jgi:hypothetical protein
MKADRYHFREFYKQVFLPEHRHPANVALHVLGTMLGIVYAIGVLYLSSPWLLVAFPVVHALPGLVGHRLFERNVVVGDIRVLRKDYPPLWFIAGNHLMSIELLLKGFYWRAM